jgi:hypothetical protein
MCSVLNFGTEFLFCSEGGTGTEQIKMGQENTGSIQNNNHPEHQHPKHQLYFLKIIDWMCKIELVSWALLFWV